MSIEYEKLEQIVLLFWDDKENFDLPRTKQKIGSLYKNDGIHRIDSLSSFEEAINKYDDDQQFLCLVHLAHSKENKGYDDFINSKVLMKYPNLRYYLITSALKNEVYDKISNERLDVYTYDEYQHKIFTTFLPQTKSEITNSANSISGVNFYYANQAFPQINYAVITALYKDEFEELKRVFDFPEDKRIPTTRKLFYRGYLKSDSNIEIVAAIPNSTGMVDSSIIATQMLEYFKPKYLLMSGVCGGAKNLNFGDIVVAKQVYTFQKGKVSDIKIKDEKGELVTIDLYDSNKELVDYAHLYDKDGNQISISVEKFEIEHDTMIQLDSFFEDSLNPKLDVIKNKINETIERESFFNGKKIDIVVEPMACSTMVINKEGFFEDTIKSIHRKTAAIEMESYGVARACQFANNGKTIPLIFKSVMDNTVNKQDSANGFNVKKFAAYTSAQFMKHLFEEKVI